MELWLVLESTVSEGRDGVAFTIEEVRGVWLSYGEASDHKKVGQRLRRVSVRPTEVAEFMFDDVNSGALKLEFTHQFASLRGSSDE
jgi:hypothetical protein